MKSFAASAAIATVIASLYMWLVPARPEAPENLLDRVWIDHIPRSPTDLITHLLVLSRTEGPDVGGALGHSSQWRVHVELFQRKLSKDRVRMFFPQRGRALDATVRTWTCKGEAPAPFELCLEIGHGKEKLKLYSMREWTIDGELPTSLAPLAMLPPVPDAVPTNDDGDDVALMNSLPPELLP